MMVDTSTTLSDVITSHPALSGELERLGLNYRCGGEGTLAACAERGLDVAATVVELRTAAAAADGEAPSWASMGIVELVDHLEGTDHRYLWAELPRLAALIDKIVEVHGERHSDLFAVAHRFVEVRADLEAHLAGEEGVPPTDGCASYRSCYAGVAALEADVHLHVHKENNLLFPAVARLAQRLAGDRS